MKKFSLLLVVVMLILVGCNKGDNFNSVEKIKENGEIVLLTESGFPPFEYAFSGDGSVDNIAGVDIDFAKALADKLGVKLKIVDMNFNNLTTSLAANKGDFIAAGLTINEERAKVVDFSKVYFDNGLVILVSSDSTINSVADLANKKIAVQEGSSGNNFADTLDDVEVLTFTGMIEAGLSIKNGNSDAAIMDILTAKIIASQNPELKVVEDTVVKEEIAFAVGKNNESLLNVINELIDELNAKGQIDAWFENHYDSLLED